ncbi:transposase [Escherichia coli]|nr:transposase [Escherichia coli]KUW02806.1 transposase [Escherichia coli]KUX44261.1 transposase [Escherichia coli]KZH42416.1 transposase [Escherichia coli]KZI59238.1 transposase [Escherichia coli]
MELQDWRKEPRKNYSNEFKLRMVELASQPGACVAQIARENGVNDNVIFKWLRLWLIKGRISRRLPVTNSSGIGVELLPVEMTLDERPYPVFTRGNYEDQ